MRILSLDLDKLKTAAYLLVTDGEGASHTTVRTTPQVLHDLLIDLQPDRVVFEICPLAGWLCDLTRALGLDTQVPNVAHDAWRWRNVRSKSDRLDAQKLAELSVRSVNAIYLKVRRRIAEHCEAQNPFREEVEVDESYFGPKRVRGKRGRGAGGKTIVFGVFKRKGCVYTENVPDCHKKTLIKAIRGHVGLRVQS